MVLRKKDLAFILITFILLNPCNASSYSKEKLKLRFKTIKIYNETNSYEIDHSNAIEEYLKHIFSEKGDLQSYLMEVFIKQYNVSVKKINNNKVLRFKGNDFVRTHEHKLILVIDLKKQPNTKILQFKIDITESKKVSEYLTIKERKVLNRELLKQVKIKLNRELRQQLLLKMGDFILPN